MLVFEYNGKKIKASRILARMKSLLDTEKRWTKRHFALNAEGKDCPSGSPQAVCHCLSGALAAAANKVFQQEGLLNDKGLWIVPPETISNSCASREKFFQSMRKIVMNAIDKHLMKKPIFAHFNSKAYTASSLGIAGYNDAKETEFEDIVEVCETAVSDAIALEKNGCILGEAKKA